MAAAVTTTALTGRPADVRVGTSLPPLTLDVSPTFVVSTAVATRDFQDVHHDRDRAVASGSTDIFVNILTSTGLVQRYVTDWAGPLARVGRVSIRLGVPCYAYDELSFRGDVASLDDGVATVVVVGSVSRGDHVTGQVTLTWADR